MAKRRFTAEEAAERHRLRQLIYRRNKRAQLSVPTPDFTRPPDTVLAEREHRLSLPRSAFGDPLPGYSALDKNRRP